MHFGRRPKARYSSTFTIGSDHSLTVTTFCANCVTDLATTTLKRHEPIVYVQLRSDCICTTGGLKGYKRQTHPQFLAYWIYDATGGLKVDTSSALEALLKKDRTRSSWTRP